MILTLKISQDGPGRYAADVQNGRETVGSFEATSIAAAIRECASLAMPGLVGFHIWCDHVSIGTTALLPMRHDAETLAQRLLGLKAQFFGIHDEVE